ncbi:MAG: SPOR domain-containing protein [Gammaproteobacteria bacterium]|nr:SPOR domain-containing protein [Gammaproteobacteria bacterium]
MAKAPSRQKRRRNRRRDSASVSRGTLVFLLLACTALLAWLFRAELDQMLGAGATRAAPAAAAAAKETSKPARQSATEPRSRAPEAAGRFEFYYLLPDAEVDVPEQPAAARPAAPPPVSVPGAYVVQAGAFPSLAAADKVKVRLAALGVVSEIQTADANGAVFHRVRIGPIENLEELNRLRAQLRQNGIDHQVIPIGE